MFFYRVSFPSSLGCPEAGFLIFLLYVRPPEDVSLELQPRAESLRQGEAERRPSLAVAPLLHPSHPSPSPPMLARTPLQSLSPNFLMKPAEVSAQRMLLALLEKAATPKPLSFHRVPGRAARAGPRSPTARHAWKKHMHRLLRNTSCNSNDKVRTET